MFVFISRSAKEAEDNIRKALAKGQVLPKEERFDSNCITPGMDMYMYIIVSLYLACVYMFDRRTTFFPQYFLAVHGKQVFDLVMKRLICDTND